jgi:ankyrin repeat protein
MRAVSAGHKDVAKLLLNAGANGTKPHEGTYPIHMAASNYDTAMIQLLLPYVDHNSFDDIGQTALHLSIKKRTSDAEDGVYNEDGVRMLLEAGADPNCSDNFMRSPIHIAAQRGLLGAVQVLLKFGAYPVISSTAVLARENGFEDVALVLESAASEQLNILGFRWWF